MLHCRNLIFFHRPIWIRDEKFLDITSNVSEGCREEFLKINKKTNYVARLKLQDKSIKHN